MTLYLPTKTFALDDFVLFGDNSLSSRTILTFFLEINSFIWPEGWDNSNVAIIVLHFSMYFKVVQNHEEKIQCFSDISQRKMCCCHVDQCCCGCTGRFFAKLFHFFIICTLFML